MIAIESHIEKFKYIDPGEVETYLNNHKWTRNQQSDKASIWTLDGFEILLPLKPEIIDFPRRMGEVIETLAIAENRLQIEIFSDLITSVPNTTIQGVVTHIATPNADNLSGEVTLLGVVVFKLRPIYTELTNRNYILALKAYQERLPIYCKGDLIRNNNIFVLKNPHELILDNIK